MSLSRSTLLASNRVTTPHTGLGAIVREPQKKESKSHRGAEGKTKEKESASVLAVLTVKPTRNHHTVVGSNICGAHTPNPKMSQNKPK